jgi:hypothetical protein
LEGKKRGLENTLSGGRGLESTLRKKEIGLESALSNMIRDMLESTLSRGHRLESTLERK